MSLFLVDQSIEISTSSMPRRRSSSFLRQILVFFAGFLAGVSFRSVESSFDAIDRVLLDLGNIYDDAAVVRLLTSSSPASTHEKNGVVAPKENDNNGSPSSLRSTARNISDNATALQDTTIAAANDKALTAANSATVISTAFPKSLSSLVVGMGRVDRKEFFQKFDIGYGMDTPHEGNNEVLILYQSEKSLPHTYSTTSYGSGNGRVVAPLQHDVGEATRGCDVMKVVMTDPRPRTPKNKKPADHKKCIAIVGNWESSHVHKYARDKKSKTLRYKESYHRPEAPTKNETRASEQAMVSYLSVYEDALTKLRPIAESAARGGKDDDQAGPIIVMVANYGQSQFFINFCCSARARGLDISRVLLFATDQETYELAHAMGINVFYDSRIFESIPSGAAVDYHDLNYGRIMMSKVYCVHLVNALGYDLLFQDLDLVWYRDPIPYFTERQDDFDMYFQHDGTHHPSRFAPLAANTGFYYVRHNARTEHFFSVFVRMGDLVITERSHQAAFTTLANEHMSLRGLRVKVLAEDHKLFLSGFHIHAEPRTMKRTKSGDHVPYLLHVNWMSGKDKQPTLNATGNWYVQDSCGGKSPSVNAATGELFYTNCCRENATLAHSRIL